MAEGVDPAADALWAAVGSVETATGERKAEPHTDKDWKQLAGHAKTLVDAAGFLDSLPPAVTGDQTKVADAHIAGTRSPQQIDADIKGAPVRFRAAVAVFRHAADDIQLAIKARDKSAFFEAGERLDAACDTCHFQYWHPRVKRWTMPPPGQFEQYRL